MLMVEEVAAGVVAQWAELSQIPLGWVGENPRRRNPARPEPREHDVLDDISPPDYVEALTGVEVPRHGMVRCPLPDHVERTPSFKVYESPDRGWFCFGCCRGGSIYDLGAALWGMSTRGAAFHDLRRELARALLRGAA
jgi:CHC2 zinc finger